MPFAQAAQNVVPVAVTAGDKIEGLRQWASGRCLSADRAGVYSPEQEPFGGRVRRVVREPGVSCPSSRGRRGITSHLDRRVNESLQIRLPLGLVEPGDVA